MAITVDQLKEKLELTPYYVEDGSREVTGGYTGDLLFAGVVNDPVAQ